MRFCVALVVMAGCDGSSSAAIAITGGPLVTIAEGETTTLHVDAANPSVTLAGGDAAPSWVSVDGGSITLTPDCTVVSGTSGAPRLISLEVSDGHTSTPLLVQVSPSATGLCLPTLLACLPDVITPCNMTAPPTCAVADAIADNRLDITFPAGTDRQLVMTLHDPDTTEALSALPTTTAPIKLQSDATGTNFCAIVPAAHVVGNFNLSYIIARGMNDEAPVVATGAFRVSWDIDKLYGVQLTTCASDGMRDCQIVDDGACIRKDAAGDAITVGVRVWISQKGATMLGDGTVVPFTATPQSGPAIPLATATQRASGQVPLTITKSVLTEPFDVTADLGAMTGPVTFALGGTLATATVTVGTSCP